MKNLKNIISVLIVLMLLFFLYRYIKSNASDFTQLKIVNPAILVYLFMITIVYFILNGLTLLYFLRKFDIELDFIEWFGLSVATSFYNIIAPFRGGMAIKAMYLKEKYKFTYTNFIASTAGAAIINMFTAALLGLVSVTFIYLKYDVFNAAIATVLFVSMAVLLLIIIFSPKIPETGNEFLNKFIRIINGWYVIKSDPRTVVVITLISILQIIAGVFSTILLFGVFGVNVDFIKGLFLSSVSILSSVIQITPSGLGIAEAVLVFSGLIIKITPAQSLAAAILGRVVSIVITGALGLVFSQVLIKRILVKKP